MVLQRTIAKCFKGILTKLIIEHIINHLATNLIYDEQHGFTKKRSTVTNLLEALNVCSEAISHNIPVDMIYLYLEKAFDKVPHRRLIKQLKVASLKLVSLHALKTFFPTENSL